jgi:pilus assembly protein CpaB
MSRNATALNPGRGNRQFILLALVLGLMGAGLVYVATSRNSSSGGGGGGAADTPVLVAKVDIAARSTITADMVEVRLVASDTRSTLAFGSIEEVSGKVTRFPISANEQVLSSKVVDLSSGSSATARSLSYIVPAGKRGFAINASEVRDVGGLLLPGDYVDVMVRYDVDFRSPDGGTETEDAFVAHILLQNVEVLAISQTIVDVVAETQPSETGQRERISEATPNPGAGTITLALTPEDAQLIYLAEANGDIRFALRPYGDAEERPIDYSTELELIPENLPNPFQR